ncbi:hypothetical protein DB88DRAFT_128535 [Papiliotrema laurentii]|uniref:Carboxylesterase type B domain-containing protein n=1 Tax=Papiliotrema laurentii TaxID=5418 RepID=A0AAD9FLH3_PAPLA|nr:hypothetical protein DB88DRAFT_128535 [Papiliotrema laurentii]
MYLGPKETGNRALSKKIMRSWIAFTVNSDPNHETLGIHWPEYGLTQKNMVFQSQKLHVEYDNFRDAGMRIIIDNPTTFRH